MGKGGKSRLERFLSAVFLLIFNINWFISHVSALFYEVINHLEILLTIERPSLSHTLKGDRRHGYTANSDDAAITSNGTSMPVS